MKYNTKEELEKRESDIFKKTDDISPEIGWFYEFYEILQQIFFIIPEKRGENELIENPPIYLLQMVTILRIIHTSNSIIKLISIGYYHEGMILLRSIQEEYHHLLFFTFHPRNYIKQWKEGRIKNKQINQYMITSRYIPERWKAKKNLNDPMYSVLSSYVHPNIGAWGSIVEVKKDPLEINLKALPRYEQNSFNTVFTGVLVFLVNTISLLMEVYQIEITDAGILETITKKISQFEFEYLNPTLELMKSEYDTNIIG